MTRFARSKGSKASNTREPESATSWQEMKQNSSKRKISENNQSVEYSSKHNSKHSNNTIGEKQINTKWSDFPDISQKPKKHKKDKTLNKKQSDADNSQMEQISNGDDENLKKKKMFSEKEQNLDAAVPDDTKFNKKAKERGNFKFNEKKQKFNTPIDNQHFSKKGKGKNNFKEYKRRKPGSEIDKMFINGIELEIAYYDGFPIKKDDAERLKKLKKEMISKGLPRSEITAALKLERRKAEKALAREKKKVCFNCRQSGHTLSECTQLRNESNTEQFGTGICFKCGSTEHTYFECKVQRGDNFKFAQCFICKEQGHIARQCPDNSRGLYPKGGACNVCGDVTHLKKDCPKYQAEQEQHKMVADTINDQNIESLGNEIMKVNKKSQKLQKVIKF